MKTKQQSSIVSCSTQEKTQEGWFSHGFTYCHFLKKNGSVDGNDRKRNVYNCQISQTADVTLGIQKDFCLVARLFWTSRFSRTDKYRYYTSRSSSLYKLSNVHLCIHVRIKYHPALMRNDLVHASFSLYTSWFVRDLPLQGSTDKVSHTYTFMYLWYIPFRHLECNSHEKSPQILSPGHVVQLVSRIHQCSQTCKLALQINSIVVPVNVVL